MSQSVRSRSGEGRRHSALPPRRGARFVRRVAQGAALVLFLLLIWLAAFPLPAWQSLPVNSFLRLDPLLAVGTMLAARAWVGEFFPGLVLLLLALLVGRFFCGNICPMGSTLDLCSGLGTKLSRRWGRVPLPAGLEGPLPKVRYVLLAALLGAAALGLNIFFWASPLPLATALYALFLHPLLLLLGKAGLTVAVLSPDPTFWGLTPDLSLVDWKLRHYAPVFFSAGLLLAILGLEYVRPRFWCRFLCPAGALLGLVSLKALWRRRVQRCTQCTLCRKFCPTAAISTQDMRIQDGGACIACRQCVDICPSAGTSFALRGGSLPRPPAPAALALPSRRAFLAATGAGIGAGMGMGLLPALGGAAPQPNPVLRPPGAVPEADFLARCARCGLCMKACPGNALQPLGLGAGLAAIASPILAPRRGPCEPDCHVCGQVCPSAAIAPLPLKEKQWAKVGTAVVLKDACVAWHEARRCMVCQEVCPFGAIDLVRAPEAAPSAPPVPMVQAPRCFGCGYCEYHCPVTQKAIHIVHTGAVRLPLPVHADAYARMGTAQGLELERGRHGTVEAEDLPSDALPPGFTE